MRGEDREARAQLQSPFGGGPGRLDAAWNLAGSDDGSGMQGTVPADLVADTVEALQARRDDGDRDALRGTIDPTAAPRADAHADPVP